MVPNDQDPDLTDGVGAESLSSHSFTSGDDGRVSRLIPKAISSEMSSMHSSDGGSQSSAHDDEGTSSKNPIKLLVLT